MLSRDTRRREDRNYMQIKLKPGAIMPTYQTEGAAGMDIHAHLDTPIVLAPGKRFLVPTGVSLAIPPGFEGQVRARSGLAGRHGLAVLNAPGTLDFDFRGEIKVILINLGEEPVGIAPGDRIAQVVFSPIARMEPVLVDELDETPRGEGGFGSTGV